MKFRLARKSDLGRIAEIRYAIRSVNDNGIFALMGKPFIKAYYRIAIESPSCVFVCAENDNGIVQGIAVSFLDSEKFDAAVKAARLQLAWGAISSLIARPTLLSALISRYRSVKNKSNAFVHNHGVRGGFWGWAPENPDPISSFELHERMLAVVASLGAKELFFEVDKVNKQVYKFHKMNGAQELQEIELCDGRQRALMKYDLTIHKFKMI